MKKLLNLFLTLNCMLLACYTPYTFSSEIFGPIEPSREKISQARSNWLKDDIIEAMSPDLSKNLKTKLSEDEKLDVLLDYFKRIYDAKKHSDFTARDEYVLQAIIMEEKIILQDIKELPKQKYPEEMANHPLERGLFRQNSGQLCSPDHNNESGDDTTESQETPRTEIPRANGKGLVFQGIL